MSLGRGRLTAASLSSLDFAHNFHWDILMPDLSSDWIPCQIVNEDAFKFSTGSFTVGAEEPVYPTYAGAGGFSVTMIETADYDIKKYIKNWQKKIYNAKTRAVHLLGHEGVARRVILMDLDYSRSVVDELIRDVLVIPKDDITIERASGKGDIISIQIGFAIVGTFD